MCWTERQRGWCDELREGGGSAGPKNGGDDVMD